MMAETTHVLVGLAVTATLWQALPHVLLFPWVGAVFVATFTRSLLRRRIATAAFPPERVSPALRSLIVMSGLAWGVGAFVHAPRLPFVEFALVMVVFCGLCGGAAMTLIADPPSYYGFLASMLVPLVGGLLRESEHPVYRSATALVVLYGILMVVTYRRAHRALLSYIETANALERSEATAVQEHHFLDQVIARVPSAIVVLNDAQIVTHINAAFEAVFGFTAAEVVGHRIEDVVARPGDREESARLRAQAIESGVAVAEVERIRKDGRQITAVVTVIRIESTVGAVLAVYEDVTERRTRERRAATLNAIGDALSEAKTEGELAPLLLRVAAERMGWEIAAWWTLDREHNAVRCDTVWVAPNASRPDVADFIRGSRRNLRGGVVGRAWHDRSPVWANSLADAFGIEGDAAGEADWTGSAAALSVEVGDEIVAAIAFYSGTQRDRDEDALDAMSVISRQIGAVKQRLIAETALRDAELRYRQLVETATDVVWRIDTSGRFTFLNNASEQVFGWKPEQLLGRPFAAISAPQSADRDRTAIAQILAGGELSGYETVSTNATGGRVHTKMSGRPVRDAGGGVIGGQGIAHDISLEVATREALGLARITAEQADAAKSAFLANMSHEIRTPMTGILGTADLILDGDLSAEQRHSVELIVASGETLLRIINDILDLSKIEAGQLEFEDTRFDLHALMNRSVSLLAHSARGKGIDVILEIRNDAPRFVRGDPTRLGQVMGNLVSNAIKFTSAGTVVVSVSCLSRDSDGTRLRFGVRDTGIGIAPDATRRIFEPFRQGDVSTTRNFGGTGLGLSISRRIVEIMGGTLEVTSVPGEGSDFNFTVILAATGQSADETRIARRHATSTPRNTLRILIAEDNPVNQEVAATMLRRRGHFVDVVANGREAVDALANHSFDVVLMDMQMPMLDGIQATVEIRAREGERRVPIIALTANAATGERDRCIAAGMNDYVAKPFRAVDLIAAVERAAEASGAGADAVSPAVAGRAEQGGSVAIEGLRAELRDAGAEDALSAVLTVFVGDAPVRMKAINEAIASGEAQQIQRAAHAYKSSAGTIRAAELADRLNDLESTAKIGDMTEVITIRDRVLAAHDAAMTQLRAWLAAQPKR